MHGQGYAPPQPGRPAGSTLAALRALFAALTLLSCGFLGWVAMIRLAVVTRRPLHWALLCVVVAMNIGLLVYAGVAVPEDEDKELSDPAAITILLWLLVNTVGVLTYYFYAELRHYERLDRQGPHPGPHPHAPQQPPLPQAGYGYPQAHHTPVPQQPAQPPHHHTPVPQQPAQPPAPPHRIGQVRAELDELSELLRREERDR
ncbi:hypothetical protein ACM614_23455 [Streptomyces sp. 12297]